VEAQPIALPQPGEKLPFKTREQVLKLLPHLCNKAQPDMCTLEIAHDPMLNVLVERLYRRLLQSSLGFSAKSWLKSLLRYEDDIPEPVRQALVTVGQRPEAMPDNAWKAIVATAESNRRLLAVFFTRQHRLWKTEATIRV